MSIETIAHTESLIGRVALRYEQLIRPDERLPPEYLALPMGEIQALHIAA